MGDSGELVLEKDLAAVTINGEVFCGCVCVCMVQVGLQVPTSLAVRR